MPLLSKENGVLYQILAVHPIVWESGIGITRKKIVILYCQGGNLTVAGLNYEYINRRGQIPVNHCPVYQSLTMTNNMLKIDPLFAKEYELSNYREISQLKNRLFSMHE